jgi:hypothetical protein
MSNRLHIYPKDSAMHGAWELRCFAGWLVLFPPVYACGERQRFRAYWSPNATPWHHRMVPLWGTRKPADCSCGEPGCPTPRWTGQEETR